MKNLGITIYSCEQDEADLFHDLAPKVGVVPTITSDPVSDASLVRVPGNRCISVGHKSEISGSTLRVLKDAGVDYISTRSIGFDHIDLDVAGELGITVENVVYAPDGVADFTLMLIIMSIRNTKQIVRSAEAGDFRLPRVRGKDLCDMTVGVVGVGHIGTAVIRRLQGFGCRVLASNDGRPAEAEAEFVALDELLFQSDVVTLHVPLNQDTHHLIGREQIEAMKPGSYLVNTGRGALIDTGALIDALESGKLGGAALDVLEDEDGLFYFDRTGKPVHNRNLLSLQMMSNVIVTPHTAYYTGRTLYDTVENTLLNCLSFERSRASGETEDRDLVRGLLGGA